MNEVNGIGNAIGENERARLRDAAIFVLLLASSAFVGCSEEHKSDRLYAKAAENVRAGDLETAVRLFEETIRDYPETEAARKAREDVSLYRSLARAEEMYPVRQVRDTVVRTARALERYRMHKRRWPETLDELIPDYLGETPIDPWRRPLLYKRKHPARGYLLATLGDDGKRGGVGPSADLFVEDGSFVRRPSEPWP